MHMRHPSPPPTPNFSPTVVPIFSARCQVFNNLFCAFYIYVCEYKYDMIKCTSTSSGTSSIMYQYVGVLEHMYENLYKPTIHYQSVGFPAEFRYA